MTYTNVFFQTASHSFPLPEAGLPNEPLQFLSKEEQDLATQNYDRINAPIQTQEQQFAFNEASNKILEKISSTDLSYV